MLQLTQNMPAIMSNPELWNAVLARDASRDGSFVFGVRSTGIYCRPSCRARRPRREQVSFFQVPEAAEQAGFRACRRCHPRRAQGADPQFDLVRRICHTIDEHDEEPLTLKTLSTETGVSAHHLQRTFKSVMGITPRQYAESRRLHQFKSKVKEGSSVTAAMYDAGYGSSRGDRKSVGWGKRGDLGGRRIIKKKKVRIRNAVTRQHKQSTEPKQSLN